jgi:hypothetical protein
MSVPEHTAHFRELRTLARSRGCFYVEQLNDGSGRFKLFQNREVAMVAAPYRQVRDYIMACTKRNNNLDIA